MKTLTKPELIELLKSIKGVTFVSIETKTVPKVKKNCPFEVQKVSKVSGAIGFIYENSVNAQRKREELEANFKAEARTWGTRIAKTPLIEHKGKQYLEIKVQSASSDFFSNSVRVSLEVIKEYLYSKGKSRQEVEKEVILRDYDIANITRIKINNEEYTVV